MAYVVTPADILSIRYELNDNEAGLYILDDATITYYLEKNNGNIAVTSLEGAKAILLRLSMDASDEVVDVLSIKSGRAAEQYRLALQLYLRDPNLNPIMNNWTGWAGNVSKSEMQDNNNDCDNNIPSLSSDDLEPSCYSSSGSYFSV